MRLKTKLTVSRENILDSLISFYVNTCTNADQYQTLVLSLENEDVVGEGVSKDAISNFLDQFSQIWEGSRKIVPNVKERNGEILERL